jgi:4-alpha-glucanotransferase
VNNVEGAEQSIYKALINMCFRCAARAAIAPLQDYLGLGSEARLNTPGQPHGNWRWRVTAAALDDPGSDYIGALVRETGRS